ncbi:hypothetical protein CAPTEDRAFT_187565 [Capitella teleta]|uniref:Prominin-1-A n=1 Tax=Capitella teleta TaxID=283909 RepID=R7UDP7_CAPTE|nr:hypothetical protein CAPTEDRAFT_187565 [Capitella teleta]|eukprot:ELU04109.1 hypothetical protein CAPTEDRAFT_187565 [Capitella teleta]
MGDAMIQMDNSVTALKADGQTLKDELEAVVDKINNAQGLPGCEASCKALDASVLVMDADFDNLPDISSEIDLVNEVRSKNLTALVIGGQEEFNNIPETVQDKAGSVINDTKKLLDDFTISIEDQLGSLKKIPNDVVVSIDNMKADLNDVTDLVDTYDNYRWLAGVGLTCTVLLVVVLQFCGLCFGVLGHKKRVSPTDRNCMSNSGGEMLMASVGFIFMFSWLLMLLTSISFLIGVIAEKIVCEPLTDPEFKMLNSLDGPGGSLSSEGYFLSKTLLQNGSIPLTFSGLLESCKANQAAYSAMKLGALFDLNELTDYRKMIDLEAEIDKLDVDFADIVILNADTRKQLTDFQEATQMDFQGLLDEVQLSKDTTKANLADFADAVEQVANDGSNANPAKQKLLDAASDINDIDQGIYADVKARQTQLETDIRSLQTSAAAIQTSVDSVLTDADTTTNFFQTQASNLTKEAALTFIKRLLSTADQYRDKALDLIEHEIGHCKPVYDLWYSLIDRSLCQYLVDSFQQSGTCGYALTATCEWFIKCLYWGPHKAVDQNKIIGSLLSVLSDLVTPNSFPMKQLFIRYLKS